MKTIALIGAPGSGKTELAKAVCDRLHEGEPRCATCPPTAMIVDGYPLETREHGEYAIGLEGGYMANIDIACTRYRNERVTGHMEPQTMIVCGTIVETAVYTAMHFECTLATKNTEEEKTQEAMRFQAVTGMIATLYMDTFKYEKAFYLPSPQKPEDERWEMFERHLQAAFSAYSANIAPLVIEDFEDTSDLTQKRLERIFE